MKNYEEMARCVLEARDEHNRKMQIRQAKLRRAVPAAAGFCTALLLGFGGWQHLRVNTQIPVQPDASAEASAYRETAAAPAHTEITAEKPPAAEPDTQTETAAAAEQPVETERPAAAIQTVPELPQSSGQPQTTQIPHSETPETGTAANTAEQPSGITTDTPTEQDNQTPEIKTQLHWDEMAINQQYFMAETGEPPVSYHTAEQEVPASAIGDSVGQAYMSGYDWYTDEYHHCTAEVYQIKGDDTGNTIAIQFPDDAAYYLYAADKLNTE